MYFQNDSEKMHTILKLSLVALYILVGFDLVIIALGYYLVQSPSNHGGGNTLMRNIIFFVAIAVLIATFIVKKVNLKKLDKLIKETPNLSQKLLNKELFNINIIITSMCAGISVYGLVLIEFGEKIEILLLFVAMSLIGYQFFRLRPRDFESDIE